MVPISLLCMQNPGEVSAQEEHLRVTNMVRDLDGQLIYLRSCLEPLWEAVSDSVRILLTQESAITEGKLVPQEPIYETLILLTWKLSLLGLTHSLSC